MLQTLAERYLIPLDDTMRQIVTDHLPDERGFGVMIRYAMGWVNENDTPYGVPTGKRIRPTLLLLCNEAAGGDWHKALPAAAAVELLHNFSLIHDDIQDMSYTRHNRPTVWQVWGRNMGINAGDALFTLAYAALQDSAHHLPPSQVSKLWHIFNQTNLQLTRGQHLDMRFETQEQVTVDEYLSMIEGKSASLIATCAEIGAYIASDDEAIAQLYATFGLNLGLAFQIHDDVLGIWGDPKITGKSAATDIIAKKKSLPVLYGLEQSETLRTIYQKPEFTDDDVQQAVAALDAVGAQTYARERETAYYEKALESLHAATPNTSVLTEITGLLNFLFQRDY